MTDIVICVDGLDPEYLAAIETPHWDEIAAEGNSGKCAAMVPTTTNVNNVSIVTASFPERHGITSNTYYDEAADERRYMIDPDLLACDTVFQSKVGSGQTVGALVAKRKLEPIVGQGCDLVASAEEPPAWLTDAVGDAPDIYSGEASRWLLDAALHVIESRSPDVLYVSTTDVVPHKHAPEEPEAEAWLRSLDTRLGTLHEQGHTIVATADHGMSHKSRCVDVESVLEGEGYPAEVIRLIRDEHTYHHQNLGGAAYVYLHDDDVDDVRWLEDLDGVDELLDAEAASERFHLGGRIGDAMILGTRESVFGPVDGGNEAEVDLRSHGSTYERTVPYVSTENVSIEFNKDVFDRLLA